MPWIASQYLLMEDMNYSWHLLIYSLIKMIGRMFMHKLCSVRLGGDYWLMSWGFFLVVFILKNYRVNESTRWQECLFTKAKSGSGDLIIPHLKWPVFLS